MAETAAARCSSRATPTAPITTVPTPRGPCTTSGVPLPSMAPGSRWTLPLASMKYWLSGPSEPLLSVENFAASSASSAQSRPWPPSSSTCSTRAEVRSRRVKSTWAAIIRQAARPALSALALSGTFSTFWSSGASATTSLRRAVPVGKRESTTGRSQFVGPSSSVLTVCVAVLICVTGSVPVRT
ncbi:hypothetical protein SMICM304S_03240 [Streptomyces microflavus]